MEKHNWIKSGDYAIKCREGHYIAKTFHQSGVKYTLHPAIGETKTFDTAKKAKDWCNKEHPIKSNGLSNEN